MIFERKIITLFVGVLLLTWGSLSAHDWWVAREAAGRERIAQLQREIAAGNARVKARDHVIDSLERDGEVQKAQIHAQEVKADSSAQGWAEAKAELAAIADRNNGPVPYANVEAAGHKVDVALLDCQGLNVNLQSRITNLEAQVAEHKENRVDLDAISAKKDSVLAETVKILDPPWWKRSFSWIQDHAITLTVGAVGGFAGGVAIAKR